MLSTERLPQAVVTIKDSCGRQINSSSFSFNTKDYEQQMKKLYKFTLENAKMILLKNESQVSFDIFDLKQTKSSTPLIPDRPSNGSDELFSSDLSRPDMGSLELQSHGQATDDMDTQPPLLYMDSRLADQAIHHVLEEVSEDDDEPSQQCSASSCGTILNSLGIDHGRNEKAFGGILQCTPTDPIDPSPEMFRDLKFVLTCEVERSHDSLVGFRKEHYTKRLVAGGGIVYDEIPRDVKNTILISNEHCQTSKYFHALLLGIPCVSHEWIEDCVNNNRTYEECRINRIQRTLYLRRGRDLVTEKVVRQDKDLKEPLKPFKRQIVYLQGSKKFKESWTELVETGGGEAIKAWFRNTSELSLPTIVASDCTSRPSKTTVNFNVPIVNQDWLKQCVILGKLANIDPFKQN